MAQWMSMTMRHRNESEASVCQLTLGLFILLKVCLMENKLCGMCMNMCIFMRLIHSSLFINAVHPMITFVYGIQA